MSLEIEQTVNNRYRIVALLGKGGFGAVYRAWDINLESPRAIKENLETSPQAQRQFKREAQILDKLSHPNLPRVIDHFYIADQGQYLVMDFVEGKDLQQMLDEHGEALPEEQVVEWIAQVCDALSYLHDHTPPVVHRDIKPANIRITPENQAMLVDFGIAKITEAGMQTSTGAKALTPGFAPVEQYGQGSTDSRSDLYSLGATLYALLTGVRPVESIRRTLSECLAPPEKINPKLSISMASMIRKAMEIVPQRRFQTAAEFKSAMLAAHAGSAMETEPGIFERAPQPPAMQPFAKSSTVVTPAPTAYPSAVPTAQSRPRLRWGLLGIGAIALFSIIVCLLVLNFISGFIDSKLVDSGSGPTTTSSLGLRSTGGVGLEVRKTSTVPPPFSGAATPPGSLVTPGIVVAGRINTPVSGDLSTTVEFKPGQKPDDIPVMPNAEELTVFLMNEGTTNEMIMVTFYLDATVDEIVTWYMAAMSSNGWTSSFNNTTEGTTVVNFIKESRQAILVISEMEGRMTVGIYIKSN